MIENMQNIGITPDLAEMEISLSIHCYESNS